jgi:hypothetical protein
MPPRRQGPDKEWLADRVAEGYSDQEIANLWAEKTGVLLTRQGINRLVNKWDLRGEEKKRQRYDDLLPWKVKAEHDGHWYQRLLRVEAKLRRGEEVPEVWKERVERWKAKLKELNAVVAYVPDSPNGFYLVKAKPGEELITLRQRGD